MGLLDSCGVCTNVSIHGTPTARLLGCSAAARTAQQCRRLPFACISITGRPLFLSGRASITCLCRAAAPLRMQREDAPAGVGVIQPELNMLPETQPRRPGGRGSRRRPWTLLTPTVLWSVVILAMAPSFYGFAGGLSSLPAGASSGGRSSAVEAADLPGSSGAKGAAGSAVGARSSPFAAASWLKERVRDGKRRVHMQVGFTCLLFSGIRDAGCDVDSSAVGVG